VVNQELATLKPGYAPSTLQIKRSRNYQISGRVYICLTFVTNYQMYINLGVSS
jgi:hypothetical protein